MMDMMSILAGPVSHVVDQNISFLPKIFGMSITNACVTLVLTGVLMVLLILPAAKRIALGQTGTVEDLQTRGTVANMVEAVCLYLRNDVFHDVLGDDTDKYTPVLWTFFWFILLGNLLGLVPILDVTAVMIGGVNNGIGIGGTPTQPIWVTGALAGIAFVWFNGVGFLKDPKGYLLHMTGGAPIFMWPIMVPVEILGTLVKPVALALRLFANLTGGHIIVATLMLFAKDLLLAGWGLKVVAVAPIVGVTVIYFLEIMVCFIQAYVFTFLCCLFLGQLVVHHDHDHEEHGEHAH